MLNQKDRKRFRAIGHHLNPIVTIAGKGLSEGVASELERALNDHELIKIKLVAEREERTVLIEQLKSSHRVEVVQQVGKTALLFRASDKPDPALSNIKRINIF